MLFLFMRVVVKEFNSIFGYAWAIPKNGILDVLFFSKFKVTELI